MNRNKLLPYLVLLSALLLAISAAYFSITGLSRLFSGSAIAVIIMASVLEFSKIVTASFIHTFWKKIGTALKFYLTSGVVVLSIITSIGIYGFLSNAYTITSGKLDKQSSEIVLLENKRSIFEEQKSRFEGEIDRKNSRINQIINLRSQQESRIDSLYKKGMTSSARNTEKTIKESDQQIKDTNKEIDGLNLSINSINDSISNVNIKIIEYQNSDIAAEIGPLRFISEITGLSMDSIVNFLILMFVFVFDPLAITLVIASNVAFDKNKEEKSSEPEMELLNSDNTEEIEGASTDDVVLDEESWIRDEAVADHEAVNNNDVDVNKAVLDESSEEEMSNPEEGMAVSDEEEEVAALEEEGDIEKEVDDNNEETYFSEKSDNQDVRDDVEINEAIREHLQSDLIKSIDKKNSEKYNQFLSVLFMDGAIKIGDNIPSYGDFIKSLKSHNIDFEKKEIKDFLILCNLMKIIYMDDKEKRVLMDYEQAKKVLSIIC